MKVLIVGSGGREHALCHKLKESPLVAKLYCAPGNAGISSIARCVDIKATDVSAMTRFVKSEGIEFVVVAPDDPLMLGMVDAMEKEGIKTFGPRQNAAVIEGSKVFSKELMKKYKIPTARYEVFDTMERAMEYIKGHNSYPTVIKAEGLALGKGVVIAQSEEEAKAALFDIMEKRIFGDSGNRVVVEEFLTGPEVSVLAFSDGKTIVPMVSAQDHKRVFDGDMGPNTGGMGTFSPSRIYTKELSDLCMETIFLPTMHGMNAEGRPFKGCLYFGLMITADGPKVIEYNARFGDPEAQVVLPRLKSDLMEIFLAIEEERLGELNIEWHDNAAVCIVMASGGYPGSYQTGLPISGIEAAEELDGTKVYHAGTRLENGCLVTAGGRVLGVTRTGDSLDKAIGRAYEAVSRVSFDGAHYRRDIGIK